MTTAPAPHRQSSSWRGVFPRALVGALGLVAAAVVSGLVFAAWQTNGPALMNAFVANGLAWCL